MQQRIRREERVQRGTRDLIRGLDTLAGGSTASGPSSSTSFRLSLSPQDRQAIEGQVRDLARELRQGAASATPPEGWQALARLSRDSPGYGTSVPGPPRGGISAGSGGTD